MKQDMHEIVQLLMFLITEPSEQQVFIPIIQPAQHFENHNVVMELRLAQKSEMMGTLTTMMDESQTEVELKMDGFASTMFLVLMNVKSEILDITRIIKPIQLFELQNEEMELELALKNEMTAIFRMGMVANLIEVELKMVMFELFPVLILMYELNVHQDSTKMTKTILLNESPDVEMGSERVMKFEMMETTMKMMDVQAHVY